MSQPVEIFVCGYVSVSVFKNESEYGGFHSCTVSVRYRDGNSWKYTQSLRASDLIVAQRLMADAVTYMLAADADIKAQNKNYSKKRQQRDNEDDKNESKFSGTRCSECLEPQFYTPSGVTCSNGHGGAPPYGEEPDGDIPF